MKIGHAHLKVRDLDLAIEFYTELLDLKVIECAGGRYAFLSAGDMHHELGLQSVGADAPQPPPGSTGLFHVAFEVPDQSAFARVYQMLKESRVEVELVDHRISWAMYFDDPDGNGLEIYWDTRQESFGEQMWEGETLALPEEKLYQSEG